MNGGRMWNKIRGSFAVRHVTPTVTMLKSNSNLLVEFLCDMLAAFPPKLYVGKDDILIFPNQNYPSTFLINSSPRKVSGKKDIEYFVCFLRRDRVNGCPGRKSFRLHPLRVNLYSDDAISLKLAANIFGNDIIKMTHGDRLCSLLGMLRGWARENVNIFRISPEYHFSFIFLPSPRRQPFVDRKRKEKNCRWSDAENLWKSLQLTSRGRRRGKVWSRTWSVFGQLNSDEINE